MAQTITKTYSTAGSFNIRFPSDVTSVQAQMWGGGGGAGGVSGTKSGGGGGAGGAYVVSSVTVTAGVAYPVVVGAGGTAGAAAANGGSGDASWFAVVGSALAPGGNFGTGGSGNNTGYGGGAGGTTGAIGTLAYMGGTATTGTTGVGGGAGGGGASDTGVGGNASGLTGGTGALTGGGAGGNARGTAGGAGIAGTAYGGGAGGPYSNNTTDRAGAVGGAGAVVLSYSTSDVDIYSIGSVTIDNAAAGTIVYTVPSGYTQTGLLVGVLCYCFPSQSGAKIATITLGTQSPVAKIQQVGPAGMNTYSEWWYLASPLSGIGSIVITPSAPLAYIRGIAMTLLNVGTSQADATSGTTNTSTATTSVSITTVTDRSIVFSGVQDATGSSGPTPSSPQITLYNPDITDIFSYTQAKTPAGTVTHTYSGGAASDSWDDAIISIYPYPVAAGSFFPMRTLLGVGT